MYCKECGSTVTRTDRFCPACGTPNVTCKFHPKFGPALRIVEPRIVFEPAPPGTPSCPRCHRSIERSQAHCRGCGMDLDGAWERCDQIHVLDIWRNQVDRRIEPYRSVAGLARILRVVLSVGTVLAAVIGVANLWLLTGTESAAPVGSALAEVRSAVAALTVPAVILFVVGLVVAVAWMRRAYRNLTALAVGDQRFDRRWVVLGWLVPGVNLIRPKQIMDDLWRASHPLAPPFSSSWRVGPCPALSSLWWSSLLLGVTFGLLSRAVDPTVSGVAGANDRFALLFAGVAGVLLAAAAVCLQGLVVQVGDRQEARSGFVLGSSEAGAADEVERAVADLARDHYLAGARTGTESVSGAGRSAGGALVRSAAHGVYGRY